MIDLSSHTTLVIGEMNRLSEGVANSLKLAGAKCVLAHNQKSRPPVQSAVGKKFSVHPMVFDDPVHLAGQIAALPPLNSVVINPGWFSHATFLESTVEDIDRAVHQNYEQAAFILQASAKKMIRDKTAGSIILLSSIASLMPFVHTNLAGSTLAALEVVAKMAAVDFGKYGIRVNIIAAGWLNDERSQPFYTEDRRMHTPSDIPLGTVGEPADVGNVCCFLASPLSSYMTGAILPVDGGFLLTKSSSPSPYPLTGGSK